MELGTYSVLSILSLFGLVYMRLTNEIKLFAHEYITYDYPDKYLTVVNMNDKNNTRYHWDSRDGSCIISSADYNDEK